MKSRLLLIFLLEAMFSQGQMVNDRLLTDYNYRKTIYQKGSKVHTAFKPSFIEEKGDSAKTAKGKDLKIKLQPAINWQLGYSDFNGYNTPFVFFGANEKGKRVYDVDLGISTDVAWRKWRMSFTYMRNVGEYTDYQEEFIRRNKVLPGSNVASTNGSIKSDYIASFLNYKASDVFDFEIGYGRNFIGDGHRSLLLSDFANASPYLKINTRFWKLQYTNLFAAHENIYGVAGTPARYRRKYTATHFLDWKATKWLSIGLFETIVWAAKEGNYTRGFDVNYLNPVIFYRPVEFSVGSSDNAIVGTNLKFTVAKNHTFYAQLAFDEFLLSELRADARQWLNPDQDIQSGWWANKYAIQLGWTAFAPFKIEGLQTRIEMNVVRPYTYAHSNPTQAYSNYNQSLAHPLGANFEEYLGIINYQLGRCIFKFHFNYSEKGYSSFFTRNVGDNLEVSNTNRRDDYENEIGQGIRVKARYTETSIAYLLHDKWNLLASLGFIYWDGRSNGLQSSNRLLYLRLRTNLFNRYFDF
jgi:hypothetical protein